MCCSGDGKSQDTKLANFVLRLLGVKFGGHVCEVGMFKATKCFIPSKRRTNAPVLSATILSIRGQVVLLGHVPLGEDALEGLMPEVVVHLLARTCTG